jgi:hypothetical protein
MLAHSPPLPLIIDYDGEDRDVTAEDEEGIVLALELRDRVRRVRLAMPVPNMQKLIVAIDEEYPVLEYLLLGPSTEDNSKALVLPETLLAPHLRHLLLGDFLTPRGLSPITVMGIVTLCLSMDISTAFFQPNTLVQWISFMPQLEALVIAFSAPFDDEVHMPTMPNVTIPNLLWFEFRGVSAFMEAIVCQVTAPRLEKLGILFFEQPMFLVPRLVQFMNTTKNLRFDSAKVEFLEEEVCVEVYPPEEVKVYALSMNVSTMGLARQLSSVTQIFNQLSQIFSTVEHLTLKRLRGYTEERYRSIGFEWSSFLGSFSNVKTLRVDDGLVKELTCDLQLGHRGLPLQVLPKLQELTYFRSGNVGGAFTSFIDARHNAG